MTNSAEARVIASFTFIVALMLGAWVGLDNLVTSSTSFLTSEPEPGRFLVVLLPFGATAVAFQAANAVEAAWLRMLGSAAVMLGSLSSLGGVLYFLATW